MSTMANLFDDDFFDIDEDILNATGYFGQPDENSKLNASYLKIIH